MRWSSEPPEPGTKRIRSGFLLFPKRIGWDNRWLERATWEEEYVIGYFESSWYARRWLDD